MSEHGGWIWQGRQTPGWFGHGTKPRDDSDGTDPVGTLAERIASMPLTAIASLPPSKRHHRSARFEGDAAQQLLQAMTAWASATALGEVDFAARYFAASPSRPGIQNFRNAASIVATAKTFAENARGGR